MFPEWMLWVLWGFFALCGVAMIANTIFGPKEEWRVRKIKRWFVIVFPAKR